MRISRVCGVSSLRVYSASYCLAYKILRSAGGSGWRWGACALRLRAAGPPGPGWGWGRARGGWGWARGPLSDSLSETTRLLFFRSSPAIFIVDRRATTPSHSTRGCSETRARAGGARQMCAAGQRGDKEVTPRAEGEARTRVIQRRRDRAPFPLSRTNTKRHNGAMANAQNEKFPFREIDRLARTAHSLGGRTRDYGVWRVS